MKYVGTYSDPKDIVTKDKLEAVASRVSTNEDNIAMAESDIEGLQTTVGTLQTNVNNVQTALTSKQDTVVGGASTITENNLTASRALISNSSGKVSVSDVTSNELGYLDGVTSNIQMQLGDKQPTISVSGILKGTGNGNIEAAVAGVDYLAESDLYICTVTASGESYTCDKTLAQIKDANSLGKFVVAVYDTTVYCLYSLTNIFARFATIGAAAVLSVAVLSTGKVVLSSTDLQQSALVTDLEANKDNNTSYPSAKAVYDAIPHPDTKTDTQTQTVGVDTNGKLWTNTPSVTSVNNKTGAVVLTSSDVGLGNVDNVKQYSASNPPPYPVTSVNNKTGAVTLTAYDVDALPSTTEIPSKTSQLENDSGFITSAPVTSVNGDTGAVVLTASDVGAATTGNIQAYLNRTTAVDEGNTSYTSYMARGEALYSYETTPSANGCIAWTYE